MSEHPDPEAPSGQPSFSFFFFSDDRPRESDRYHLVFEAAKFADEHGFDSVWTPERHFNKFGALYPNPSVLAAAIASVTERVGIRGGSVVVPLHHPVRIAEEWAVVDNLSNGRAGFSAASGWADIDFMLSDAEYSRRREETFERLDTISRLWRGERVKVRTGEDGEPVEIQSYPRPIQPELPVWITTVGTKQTWDRAAELGYNVLTSMVGTTLEDVAGHVRDYRAARARSGHDPSAGRVTVMIHTFLGDDVEEVRRIVREPMINYFHSHLNQNESRSQTRDMDPEIVRKNKALLAEFGFERYFRSAGLFGTVETGLAVVKRLTDVGIDEIACLIDFGVDDETVLRGLSKIDELRRAATDLTAPRKTVSA